MEKPNLVRSRRWRISSTAITTGLARGILLVGTLLTVPLVSREFGLERLGIWLTLVTFTTLLGSADLGLGNGVMTAVGTASATNDIKVMRSIISNGYAGVLAVATVVGAVVIVAGVSVDFSLLLGLSDRDIEVHKGVVAFMLFFLAGMPLNITEKMQWGLQKGYVAGVWGVVGSMTTIATIVVALQLGSGFAGIASIYTGVPVLFAAANTVWSFSHRFSNLRPRLQDLSGVVMNRLVRTGGWFFVLQLSYFAAFSSDNFIIASWLGPDRVPDLAVPARLFGLVSFGLGLFFLPLWPEYARALSSGQVEWARRTLRKSVVIGGSLALISSTILLVSGPQLTRIFLGTNTRHDVGLYSLLAMLTVMTTVGTAISMLYNAADAVRFQATIGVAMAVIVIALKLALIGPLGVAGVVGGTLIGYTVIAGPAFAWFTPRLLASLSTRPEI